MMIRSAPTQGKRLIGALVFLVCSTLLAGAASAMPRCEGNLPRLQTEVRQEQTLQLLRDKKYRELQARMDGFLASYLAGRMTDEELYFEFDAFYRWGQALTPLFREWVAKFPASYAAHQGLATHLSAVAWRMRGDKMADETSTEQFEQFHEGLKASQDWAMRGIKLFKKPILSYRILLENSLALPEARPYADRILADSLRVEPDNVIVRQAYVRLLAPRWGGSLEELEDFAKAASHPGLPPDRLADVAYKALIEIADDYYVRERLDSAAAQFERAAKLCKLNEPWLRIGEIRLKQEKYADALASADKATDMVPDSPQGRSIKARALHGLGRQAEAFELLTKLAPQGNKAVLTLLGEYYLFGYGGVKRDPAEAKRLFFLSSQSGDKRAAWFLAKMDAPSR